MAGIGICDHTDILRKQSAVKIQALQRGRTARAKLESRLSKGNEFVKAAKEGDLVKMKRLWSEGVDVDEALGVSG